MTSPNTCATLDFRGYVSYKGYKLNSRKSRTPNALMVDSRSRTVIEHVSPEVDGGRFAIKRIVGDWVTVTADIFADGHDALSAVIQYRHAAEPAGVCQEVSMHELNNDRWSGRFQVTDMGTYYYTIQAWIDWFGSWRRSLAKKAEAGQVGPADLLVGATLVDEASRRAPGKDATKLEARAQELRSHSPAIDNRQEARWIDLALDDDLVEMVSKYSDRRFASTYARELVVVTDREKARFSAWYEMFPRSASPEAGQHGTFKDCEGRLPYIAEMGFDVLYLPPIHPIGRTHRKGKNNASTARPDDPGSPWAIGATEGGHKAIEPRLGTSEDFRRLMARCAEHSIEIALDLAFQCTPDHPYVSAHPEWFRQLPDGTIQYAENPPKKYEDIYPFDFESDRWRELWEELKSIVLFWIGHGVRIFRVDNPHTKPFAFWEWLIGEIKSGYPDVLFLAEAFTRPKVMYRLAKLGFTYSYTYFAWRNTKRELEQYFTELTQTETREYFRPHLWPNTPDILTEYLQFGDRPAFVARFVLAATLGANYGIYGPAFELCENRPLAPGREEYADAEKYEIKHWDINRSDSLKDLIARVNRSRRENLALQTDAILRFHSTDNEQLIAYSKATNDLSNIILVVVNLDPHHAQSGWVVLPLEQLGLDPQQPYQVHDLLTGARYLWHGPRNYVELNPHKIPAHILCVRRRIRTERDFDYFM
jgi:starch synthase (maltosyl-transferring)